MKDNRIVTIFLASSMELEEDRKEFERYINRNNNKYLSKKIFYKLQIWEDFIDNMSKTRLQDRYNKAIKECDLFVMLFCTKVGKYTLEEFEIAFKNFSINNKPLIYTYFKEIPVLLSNQNRATINSLFDFQDKLKELGHFQTRYKNIEDLQLHFSNQLSKLEAQGFFSDQVPGFSVLDSEYEAYVEKTKKNSVNKNRKASEILYNISFDDLNEKDLEGFLNLKRVKQHFQINSLQTIDKLQTKLSSLLLMDNNYLIKGSFLCLGKTDKIATVNKSSTKSLFFVFKDPNGDETRITEHIVGNLIYQFKEIVNHIRGNLFLDRNIKTREEDYDIPEKVFVELVANAFIHRDYSNEAVTTKVEIYPDRMEVHNPGIFHESIKFDEPEKIENSVVRNQEIASMFFLYAFVETAGKGIKRSQRLLNYMGLKPAKFQQSDGSVKVTIYRNNRNSIPFIKNKGSKEFISQNNFTIGILDDHDLFRSGLETLFRQTDHFNIVFSDNSSLELYSFLERNKLDILLLESNPNGESGLTILKKLKNHYPKMKVIIITIHEEPSFISHCISNGADGYIIKSTPFNELVQVVYRIIERGSFFEESVANLYIKDYQKLQKLEIGGIPISPDERELIRLLEKGLTAKEISKILQKGGRTIEGYKTALLKKTGCNNVTQLVGWAYRNGIL